MVERFNGRISEVLATNRFNSAWSLEQALVNYASIYNHHIPQNALGYRSPVQSMRNWQESNPELFNIEVYNQAGLDNYEKSISLLRPGGVIAIDNVLLFGSVVDPCVLDADLRSRISDADIDAMRKLNEKVRDDPRVEGTMLPIADGLTLVCKL